MAAYVIVRVDVTDPEQYAKYMKLSPGAVSAAGGRFLVRGGATEALEGPDEHRRVVVLEFDDMDAARQFYDSDLYVEARGVRAGAAVMEMLAVQGA